MRILLAGLMVATVAGACQPAGGGTPAPSGSPPRVTVHEVLTSAALVGRTVEVTGRCLGYSAPTIARGSPPLTRSDWQLEDQGEAVWVSGRLPEGCTSTEPASGPSNITARVAQDTLAGLGGPPAPRQYLIRQ